MKNLKSYLFAFTTVILLGCADYIKKMEIDNPAAPPKYYEEDQATRPIEQKYTRLGGYSG